MSFPTFPKIEIPNSQPNEFGVTVDVGKFDSLTVVVPPILNHPPFGNIVVWVRVDGRTAQGVMVEPGDTDPISIDIPPYALRCCWQAIDYSVTTEQGTEDSEVLMVLNEG